MWEFYLASSEATFRWGGHMVFQVQVAKSITAVPIVRDYVTDTQRRYFEVEHERMRLPANAELPPEIEG